jgi:hypothetical protein
MIILQIKKKYFSLKTNLIILIQLHLLSKSKKIIKKKEKKSKNQKK